MARSQGVSTSLQLFQRLASNSAVSDAPALLNRVSTSAPSSGYSALLHSLRKFSGPASSAAAAASSSVASAARRAPKNGLLNDLKQLSKFRLSSLVVLTASAGFVAGSGDSIDWRNLLWTSLGTFGAAACANTLNQLYEVDNDRLMTRTCNRPLPSGRMKPLVAAAFALTMGATGLGILYTQTNPTTTALGAANILLYAGVYTPLKQMSVVNTWVGAVVGAIPPLMGWAAASGQLEVGASVLAAALFSWQMPHFLALAWLCKDDYIRGGFNMLSKFDPKGRRTAFVSLRHCLYLAPIGLLAYAAEVTTQAFAWEAAALAGALGLYAARFAAAPSQASARKMFRMSLLYLPMLMAGVTLHRLPNNHQMDAEALCEKARAELQGFPQLIEAATSVEQVVRSLVGIGADLKDEIISNSMKCPSKVLCEEEGEEEGVGHQQVPAALPGFDKMLESQAADRLSSRR